MFARGADGNLWQDIWNGSEWGWQDLDGRVTSGPAAVLYNGGLRVFARGADGHLWQNFWNGAKWSWQDLAGKVP